MEANKGQSGSVSSSCFIAFVSSLDSVLLEVVDRYWARFFGCAPEALRSETAQLGAHTDYAGCCLMEFGGAPVIT